MSPALCCKFHCFVTVLDKRGVLPSVDLPKAFDSVDHTWSPKRVKVPALINAFRMTSWAQVQGDTNSFSFTLSTCTIPPYLIMLWLQWSFHLNVPQKGRTWKILRHFEKMITGFSVSTVLSAAAAPSFPCLVCLAALLTQMKMFSGI